MLDPDQQKIVDLDEGCFKILATAGAGKSEVLFRRAARLYNKGSVLCVTFTAEATKNLRQRCGKKYPHVDQKIFTTLHALALKFAHEHADAFPFNLADNPLADEGLAARAVYEAVGDKINFRAFTQWISLQKRNRVEPHESIRRAENSGKDLDFAIGYRRYEKSLRDKGLIDFDGLLTNFCDILESRPDIRSKYQFKYILVDEAQDLSRLDWRIIELLAAKYKNIMAVGDVGQCQPPGTMVTVVDKTPRSNGSRARKEYAYKEIPIENFKDGDKVLSWSQRQGRTYPTMQNKVTVGIRDFSGDLLVIGTQEGRITRVTDNHRLWVRFSDEAEGKYAVYLMYKEEYGFRVGMCKLRAPAGGKSKIFGVARRMRAEKGDRAWVLRVENSRVLAETWEEIYSVQYGIPESIFVPITSKNKIKKTQDLIDFIFSKASPEGGYRCLSDHRLNFEFPLLLDHGKFGRTRWGYYFRTEAVNLPVFAGMLEVPIRGNYNCDKIVSIVKERYSGPVYSFDVEKHHTYVADGMVVANSIFGFRGSDPKSLLKMNEMFPNTETLYLSRNYRSSKEIVNFGSAVYPFPEISSRFEAARSIAGIEPTVTGYSTAEREAEEIVSQIKNYKPEECAILGRTNASLRACEEALVTEDVPYYLLGESGFWEATEVQNVLAYIRCADNPNDNAIYRAIQTPFHPTKYVKKKQTVENLKKRTSLTKNSAWSMLGSELKTFKDFLLRLMHYKYLPAQEAIQNIIKDLRAVEFYSDEQNINPDRNPVDNLKELVRSARRFETLHDFLTFVRKVSYANKKKSGVCLSTVHSAKGKEFRHVFFISVNRDILPHSKSDDLDGERCIYFVGASRAMDTLNISYYGTPSPFLEKRLQIDEV